MSITSDDVRHVAVLARLNPTDEEIELYTGQLQRILTHVEKISELDTDGVVPITTTAPVSGRMREDQVTEGLTNEEALRNAPEHVRESFKVPRVIE